MTQVAEQERSDMLDNLTMNYFKILEELLEERRKLELFMRDGFLEIAKSRHSMGSRCVGSLQLPSASSNKCYDASFKVETNVLNTGLIEEMTFKPFEMMADDEIEDINSATGLRSRFRQQLNVSKDNIDGDVKKPKDNKTNSLNWFGILLPSSLRCSKQQFENGLISVCKIATLQNSLIRVRQEFQKLNNSP